MNQDWDTFRPSGARIRLPSASDLTSGRTHNGSTSLVARNAPEAYVAGQPFQAWCQQWAAACLRVLKPGGYLLAFGSARTWHRLACGIEDAGFEIRDSTAFLTGQAAPGLMWMYGCLTADTEILTEHGWKPGLDVTPGERVGQWDAATGQISLGPVERAYRAPWNGPLRVLRNADTDQLLTPNHRVYHQPRQRKMTGRVRRNWYEDRWQVAEAGTLSTWNQVRLPIAGEHDGPGIGGEDYAALLGWVWTEGGFDLSGSGVRIYQSSVNAEKVAEIAALMDRLGPHKRYDRLRTYTRRNGQPHAYTSTTWFISGELANHVRTDLPGKRPTYGLLWRMTLAEKRALLRAAMLGDGSELGTRSAFYQRHEDDLIWFQTLLALIGRSGRVAMRRDRPSGAVYLRNRSTTELQARHLRDSAEEYSGEVWCIQVPTGAFVARREGHIFITGNSGFPKSKDAARAIDMHVCELPGRHFMRQVPGDPQPGDHVCPESAEGEPWQGWGTAAKPAWEPIVVARKPLAGTLGRNLLEHGTGALNIDACRLDTGPGPGPGSSGTGGEGRAAVASPSSGRWPPNVVLTHSAGCREAGIRRVRGDSRAGQPRGRRPGGFGDVGADRGSAQPNGPLHGEETVPAFDCVPGCPVAELDRQSGVLRSGANPARRGSDNFRDAYGEFAGQRECVVHRGADAGGASRFTPVFRYEAKAGAADRPRLADGTAHPTVKPVALMLWLIQLVTRPGGVVLDPFAGTGTTAEACVTGGFRCVLAERDPVSVHLILERLRKPIQPYLPDGDNPVA